MNYKVRFCNRLKDIRNEKHLSQKAMAEKLGIPISTYANWEQGRTEPGITDIFCIIKVLEVQPNELFDI